MTISLVWQMNQYAEVWLGSVLAGGAVFALVYGCREHFGRALAAVEKDLADKLRRLRVATENLHKHLVAWLIATAGIFGGIWIGLGSLVFAVLISLFLLAAPWYLVRRMAEHRRRKIEDQLEDAIVSLSNAVKAGLSLPQALELLSTQCPKPIRTEFHQMAGEYKMGKPLERTLLEAKGRLRSENFALFAAAVLTSHESGGRLNETVERIAQSMRELQRLKRKVLSETAQARKSAVYMACVPAFILVMWYFVDPDNTKLLFELPFGQILLAIAVVLDVVAFFWGRAIANPDI